MHIYMASSESMMKSVYYYFCCCCCYYILNLSLPAILVTEDADRLLQSFLSLLHIALLSFTVRLLCNPTACAKKRTHKCDHLHKEKTNTC